MTGQQQDRFAAIILAAGQGKRMQNPDMAKVLNEVGGKPMIGHVVQLAVSCNASPIVVVVGYQREAVRAYLKSVGGNIVTVVQEPQLGTGHAVMQAEQVLSTYEGDLIVLSGDVPLLRTSTVQSLLAEHRRTQAVATVLTAELSDPAGYGRIIRREDGIVEKIVEHRDATEEERKICEINSGIYIFNAVELFSALRNIRPVNAQSEYYLTDIFEIFRREGKRVAAIKAGDTDEISGVNTVEQLKALNERYLLRTS